MAKARIHWEQRSKKLRDLCGGHDKVGELMRIYFRHRRHFRDYALHAGFGHEQINLVLHLMETV